MALVDCPECGHGFSQYAKTCPQCNFPNPLAMHPPARGRALTGREPRAIEHFPGRQQQPEVDRRQSPPAPEYWLPPEPQPVQREPKTVTFVAVETEPQHDNSLSGLFHGKANFWFALCVYFLGGTLALTVVAVAIGEPEFMKVGVGGWAFVGLFLLFWNAKNLAHDSGIWIARLLIVIILLAWIGVGTH